jgi:flagellar biosynthesis protein FlhF
VLGTDAVVLSARRVRRAGLSGLFSEQEFEVAAARAPQPPTPPSTSGRPFAPGVYVEPKHGASKSDPLTALRAELRAEIRAVKIAAGGNVATSKGVAVELSKIRESIELLAPQARPTKPVRRAPIVQQKGIEGAAAAALTRALRGKSDAASPEQRLRGAVGDMISIGTWPLAGAGPTVIAAVGPTGVGKTTTLAKLATRAVMEGKSVTLVSCDTFRVGGVEHMKRYADLLDVQAHVARTADELAAILAAASTDVVLVDTAGREPDPEAAERLLTATRFKEAPECQRYEKQVLLCVSASVRAVDANRIVESFSVADATAIVVTKMDETSAPAGLVHAAFATKLPIAATCAGQRVPEDISIPDVEVILDAVTGKRVFS